MPIWTLLIGFVLGAVTGSFLNMVIYRLPRAISFLNPSSSMCPICKASLKWIDLMPLFSWLSTKGKCRYCAAPVPSRYFWVEVLTGLLFAGAWYQFQIQADRGGWMGFVMAMLACLVAVIYIDWELFIIPDELNALMLVIGVAAMGYTGQWMTALTGAFAGWAVMWGISFFLGRLILGKDALGDGDIKLMRGVGAMLGPILTGISVVIGVFAGLVIGLILIAVNSKKPEGEGESPENEGEMLPVEPVLTYIIRGVWYLLCLDIVALFFPSLYKLIGEEPPPKGIDENDTWEPTATTIPFGPYLALGSIICLLFGDSIEKAVKAYFNF